MPSPSSPPTMLKPRPVEPLVQMILRGSPGGKRVEESGQSRYKLSSL